MRYAIIDDIAVSTMDGYPIPDTDLAGEKLSGEKLGGDRLAGDVRKHVVAVSDEYADALLVEMPRLEPPLASADSDTPTMSELYFG
jgi:hypothetical protein